MHGGKEREVLAAGKAPIKTPLLAGYQPDGTPNFNLLPSGWPANIAPPLSGITSVASVLRRVVLPAPLGPRSATTSPSSMAKLTR